MLTAATTPQDWHDWAQAILAPEPEGDGSGTPPAVRPPHPSRAVHFSPFVATAQGNGGAAVQMAPLAMAPQGSETVCLRHTPASRPTAALRNCGRVRCY